MSSKSRISIGFESDMFYAVSSAYAAPAKFGNVCHLSVVNGVAARLR
jgi:hypothetical protein